MILTLCRHNTYTHTRTHTHTHTRTHTHAFTHHTLLYTQSQLVLWTLSLTPPKTAWTRLVHTSRTYPTLLSRSHLHRWHPTAKKGRWNGGRPLPQAITDPLPLPLGSKLLQCFVQRLSSLLRGSPISCHGRRLLPPRSSHCSDLYYGSVRL